MKKGTLFFLSASMLLFACGQGKQNNAGSGQQSTADKGRQLFIDNCQQCHSLKQDKNGPKLEGVLDRWEGDTDKVIAFIKNSQQSINSGNTYAIRLYGTWNNAMMPPFTNLDDTDIKRIITYINKDAE